MNTAMALLAYVDTDVEFFFAKTPTEALAAVHFAGNKVMKSKRHQPPAASAGRCLFVLSHGACKLLPADGYLVDEVAQLDAVGTYTRSKFSDHFTVS